MRFSASGLQKFLECPGKFWLRYGENLSDESGYFALVGKAVHALVEQKLKTGEAVLPPNSDYGEALVEALDLYQRWEKCFFSELNPQDVLSLEEEVVIQFGKDEIVFRMDDVRDIGGFLTVTDWKTVHNFKTVDEIKQDIQARLYCVAAFKYFPQYDEMVFRHGLIRHGVYQTLELTKEEVKEWEAGLTALILQAKAHFEAKKKGDKSALPYTPGAYCQHCGFFDNCEAGKKAMKDFKGIKNNAGALAAIEKLALVGRTYDETLKDLKEWIKEHGSVTCNGMTWAWWANQGRKIDTGSLPEDSPLWEKLRPFYVLDDGKKSGIWKDEVLVKKLNEAGLIKSTVRKEFNGRSASQEETLNEGETHEG